MKAEVVIFHATDRTKLNGLIYNYKEDKDKIIICTHGMGNNCFHEREMKTASLAEGDNIAVFTYNNRGAYLVTKLKKEYENKEIPFIAGAAHENILDGYYDIKGAIEFALSLGYKKIYLQGHSLGTTKIVYTYNKLKEENYENLNSIKGVILTSLIDIPQAVIDLWNLSPEKVNSVFKLAKKMIDEGRGKDFMPEGSFIQPVSANEFYRICVDNEETNFARYHDPDYKYEKLNNIEVPLFMRWGNDGELIAQDAKDLVEMLNKKIKNNNKDFGFIDGADHSYHGHEEELARQIIDFVNRI